MIYLFFITVSALLCDLTSAFVCSNKFCLPINFVIVFLPVNTVYDFNWIVNYLYLSIAAPFAAIFFTSYSTICLILMNQACWLIDMTSLSIYEFVEEMSEKSFDEIKVTRRLISIVQMTWKVIHWQKNIQNLMKFSYLSEISMLSAIFCFAILTFSSNMSGPTMQILILLAIFTQFFLYCWLGSRYTGRVEKLSNTIYGLNWDRMAPGQRKTLGIMICMTQNMQGFSGIFMQVDFVALQKVKKSICLISTIIKFYSPDFEFHVLTFGSHAVNDIVSIR